MLRHVRDAVMRCLPARANIIPPLRGGGGRQGVRAAKMKQARKKTHIKGITDDAGFSIHLWQSDYCYFNVFQVLKGFVIPFPLTGFINIAAAGDKDNHTLAGACEQYPVGVFQI